MHTKHSNKKNHYQQLMRAGIKKKKESLKCREINCNDKTKVNLIKQIYIWKVAEDVKTVKW